MTRLRWWWRRWRAAHYYWLAEQNYWRSPTTRNAAAWDRAADYLEHVQAARP